MPAALLRDALARVEQEHGDVRRRRGGDHVPRVLDVARRVGDDELPARRREEAIGDIDGDPLLPLGAQPVGQQGKVRVVVAALATDPLDGLELVGEQGLRVVQQAPDERALAVIDRAGRGEPQQVRGHQK